MKNTTRDEETADIWNRLNAIGVAVDRKFQEIKSLSIITLQINQGVVLDEVLDNVYDSFQSIIPYDRIGLALIDNDGTVLTARWTKTKLPKIVLKRGYSASLMGSSLETIIKTGAPRILNDLVAYLKDHPQSKSTQLIVDEGIKSSLTCPLVAMGKPIGFMFFSSATPHTYENLHVELFQQLAGQLATIVEKSRLYDELSELNRLKDEFLGIVAHDLRSPIGTIMEIANMINNGVVGPVTDKQRHFLQGIEITSSRMLNQVNRLLTVSVIESGNLAIRTQSINLNEFLQECYEANIMLAKAKSIQLSIHVDKDLPRMQIDPDYMAQVINNLVFNAIKYSYANTTIMLRGTVADGEVHISVKDQGQGIPDDELHKMFRSFGRTSVKPTAGEGSIGLGLAIVKKIVDSHDGRIWVKSKVGQGSVFTVALPLQKSS